MKARVGLAASIGLNLGLVGAFVWVWFNPPQELNETVFTGGSMLDRITDIDGQDSDLRLAYPSRPNFRFPTNVLSYLTWRSIESPDYFEYVANLRAIKCPEETIADIIVADVNNLYSKRWLALLQEHAGSFNYWKTGGDQPGRPVGATALQLAQMDDERRALVRALVDVQLTDSIADLVQIDTTELALSFLSPDRRDQVMAVRERFARSQEAIYAEVGSVAELQPRLDALEAAYENELDAIMSPEERLRYEMTVSPLAAALRSELTGFEPTEEEFQEIYQARLEREEQIQLAQATLELRALQEEIEQEQWAIAQQEQAALQDELLQRLGPERFAEYQRTLDPTYQVLIRSSLLNYVHPVMANRMYELQMIADVESEKVRVNPDFTLEQREAALLGIQTETERTIREDLGPEAFRSFQTWQQEIGR